MSNEPHALTADEWLAEEKARLASKLSLAAREENDRKQRNRANVAAIIAGFDRALRAGNPFGTKNAQLEAVYAQGITAPRDSEEMATDLAHTLQGRHFSSTVYFLKRQLSQPSSMLVVVHQPTPGSSRPATVERAQGEWALNRSNVIYRLDDD